jgi:hypothetical protein
MEKGDLIKCSIWYGPQRGISIGRVNRRHYFNPRYAIVTLIIGGEDCTVKFRDFPGFWSTCPEIRVARDHQGRNKLKEFIETRNLLPPKESLETKGKRDVIYLQVVKPYRKFKLLEQKPQGSAL